jgi:hypothetical protein
VELRDGARRELAVRFDRAGTHALEPGPRHVLQTSRWGLARATRAPSGAAPRIVRALEDGPFYARSEVRWQDESGMQRGMHETVSLRRFRSRWVQSLLPFRMPREPEFMSLSRRRYRSSESHSQTPQPITAPKKNISSMSPKVRSLTATARAVRTRRRAARVARTGPAQR